MQPVEDKDTFTTGFKRKQMEEQVQMLSGGGAEACWSVPVDIRGQHLEAWICYLPRCRCGGDLPPLHNTSPPFPNHQFHLLRRTTFVEQKVMIHLGDGQDIFLLMLSVSLQPICCVSACLSRPLSLSAAEFLFILATVFISQGRLWRKK